ncbi:MAG TPA: hypothetical protein DIT95_03200 [Arenibacter sp.]|nr:hypothetical protein [Arenibacter sp.]|tara:strand:+ start:542 stop:721 length:180 start_codon:yes stop_codon:yes gene_type:complete
MRLYLRAYQLKKLTKEEKRQIKIAKKMIEDAIRRRKPRYVTHLPDSSPAWADYPLEEDK